MQVKLKNARCSHAKLIRSFASQIYFFLSTAPSRIKRCMKMPVVSLKLTASGVLHKKQECPALTGQSLLDSFIRQPYWSALLDSLIGQPSWTDLLDRLIGQPYWTALLNSLFDNNFIKGAYI